ncbi:uncharacterized protein LOC115820100 [Chanos chanos]|uniref:Uncharacterized protein LOC115820100 n=1 Tax=Chanos chanos TaxID=29144 RepID=A0A6J2W7V4_CHACN|nr:uncharacterized protein LOC115820100 [Chanos chanos]
MTSAKMPLKRTNERRIRETVFQREHVSVSDLRENSFVENRYLEKNNIPEYPKCVEFHVAHVSHVTGKSGRDGIFDKSGFKARLDTANNHRYPLLWWGLSVSDNEIASAEENFLQRLFPQRSAYQVRNQKPFLKQFTTSPAFQTESRYGYFRFTFPLKNLLNLYAEQFCRPNGSELVLRVYETVLYRREILYSVLVHGSDVRAYDDYPRLPYSGDHVCAYRDGEIVWRCQAPSQSYGLNLVVNHLDQNVYVTKHEGRDEYYAWDNVAVAFHMEPGWTLHVDRDRLWQTLSECELAECNLLRN